MAIDEKAIERIGRRKFLTRTAAVFAGAVAAPLLRIPGFISPAMAYEVGPLIGEARRAAARDKRRSMADMAYDRGFDTQQDNGEELEYPVKFALFSKGFPHNDFGEITPAAYAAWMNALSTGSPALFETLPLGGTRKFTSPQAGLSFDLEGPDGHCFAVPPAPRMDSAQRASEYAENLWMAMTRDVPFTQYESDPTVLAACDDLSHFSDFRGQKQIGKVTPKTLFRGNTTGDIVGPYVSQYLLKPIPYGAQQIDQKMHTLVPKIDYLTDYDSWLSAQNGGPAGADQFDPTWRYIRNGRDISQWVHVDALYQAYLNACLILLGNGTPVDAGNPYRDSHTQIGFASFGGPHLLALVTEVSTRALKATWFQKWFVHRNLRPEEFGGRVHNHWVTRRATYPINQELLDSRALAFVYRRHRSALLPMAFPEGCPTHPSYTAGHATVAGACVTILKAWFDESTPVTNPVVASDDGLSLVPYTGSDRNSMTVGGELNKVAANVGIGRNIAGVHWRADYWESLKLGEKIALGVLEEQKQTFNEPHSWTVTKFDGSTVTI